MHLYTLLTNNNRIIFLPGGSSSNYFLPPSPASSFVFLDCLKMGFLYLVDSKQVGNKPYPSLTFCCISLHLSFLPPSPPSSSALRWLSYIGGNEGLNGFGQLETPMQQSLKSTCTTLVTSQTLLGPLTPNPVTPSSLPLRCLSPRICPACVLDGLKNGVLKHVFASACSVAELAHAVSWFPFSFAELYPIAWVEGSLMFVLVTDSCSVPVTLFFIF